MIFFTIFKIDGWHFLNEFSKFDVKWKNNQNEGLQKIGPIICTVENKIPKYYRLYAKQLPGGTLNLRISLICILWANWGQKKIIKK